MRAAHYTNSLKTNVVNAENGCVLWSVNVCRKSVSEHNARTKEEGRRGKEQTQGCSHAIKFTFQVCLPAPGSALQPICDGRCQWCPVLCIGATQAPVCRNKQAYRAPEEGALSTSLVAGRGSVSGTEPQSEAPGWTGGLIGSLRQSRQSRPGMELQEAGHTRATHTGDWTEYQGTGCGMTHPQSLQALGCELPVRNLPFSLC